MQISKNKHFLVLGVSISMLIWGLSWPSAKLLMQYGKPLEIAIIRFAFTFLGLFVLLKLMKIKLTISQNGFLPLLLATLFVGGYSICFFNGIKHGMPGAGGVLVTTTTPLITFILATIISKKKLLPKEILGLGIGLIAGVFLLKIWANYEHILEKGNSFFLLSTVLWAFLSRVTAKSSMYGSPLAFSLWMYLGCVVFLSFFVDFTSVLHILQTADWKFWLNMIFNAVINTGLATTFYFYATSQLGAEKTSSFIYIVPFAAAIFSFFIIQEKIQWNTIVGGLLGICAVYIINSRRK